MDATFNVYDYYSEVPLPDLYQMLENNNHDISEMVVKLRHLNFIRKTLKVEIEKKESQLITDLKLDELLLIIPVMDNDLDQQIVKDFFTNPNQTMSELDRKYNTVEGYSANLTNEAFRRLKTNNTPNDYAEST